MLVLLPPSETKRAGGKRATLNNAKLWHNAALASTRDCVREALIALSQDEDAAAKALKLGVKNRAEIQHNLAIETAPTMPAIQRYTGVLYDALDYDSLDAAAQTWVHKNVAIQSALFGLICAKDPIPAYRLSAGSRIPKLGASLKHLWAPAHAGLQLRQKLIIDARSKDYAELAPLPDAWYLQVLQRAEDGSVRALNHFNKAGKGRLVRALAQSQATIATVTELCAWGAQNGFEFVAQRDTRELELIL